MEKYDVYRGTVFTITTAIVFFIWGVLQPILVNLTGINQWFSLLLGSVVSLGTYQLILKIMESLILKVTFIRRWIFGSSYLDGVWVGAYIGVEGKPRYYIEYFEQDFNSLIIRSKCYSDDYSYKGEWTSTNVSINEDKGELSYTYETIMENNKHKNIGFAIFNMDRMSKEKYPRKLHGFSSDIYIDKRIRSVEEKVSKPKELTEKELLNKAIEVYENNKDTLLNA